MAFNSLKASLFLSFVRFLTSISTTFGQTADVAKILLNAEIVILLAEEGLLAKS